LKQIEVAKAQEAAKLKKRQETEEKKRNKPTKAPTNSKKHTPAVGKGSLFSFVVSNNIGKQQTQAPADESVEYIDQELLEGLLSQPDEEKIKKKDELLLFGA